MTDALLIVLGMALLFAGGEGLVRGGSSLALRFGLTPLVVGLTVVAFGTSMPEMVVNVRAAVGGSSDLALGNVVGSNIFNVAGILGLTVLIAPLAVQAKLLRVEMPILIGITAVVTGMAWDGRIGFFESLLLFLTIITYTFMVIRASRNESAAVAAEFADGVPPVTGSLLADITMIAFGLGALVGGAELLVRGASSLARAAGVSEAIIGLTVVSVGTSLPELATSLVAAFRGKADIALGNVIGSNMFNLTAILGVSGMITPIARGGITTVDFLVMGATTVLLAPMMRTGHRISRREGAVLLAAYIGYLAWLGRGAAMLP
jgi:cation:H+ antiporter